MDWIPRRMIELETEVDTKMDGEMGLKKYRVDESLG